MFQKIKNIYHLFNALCANIWFGFPSKKITVIGVTGTDGKTTTVNIIYHVLKESGFNVSMVSSVGAIINGKNYDVGFHVTTPSSWMIQRFMKNILIGSKDAVSRPILVLEVTSHALDQNRVYGIDFAVGVLTNVTHEHLDYHKTYDNYLKTKLKLLKKATVAIVNKDDESFNKISNLPPSLKLRGASKIQNSKLQVKSSKYVTYGMSQMADINPRTFPFETKIIGEFNKYNILAAVCAARALGVNDDKIRKGIKSFKLPKGRMEMVHDGKFKVMIDFAHTPNALEKLLSSIKPEVKGRMIHVFGSAGERDYSKRPLMGEISAKYADLIILTAEDPRSEKVEKINGGIEKGIFNFQPRFNRSQFSIFNEKQNDQFLKDEKFCFKIPDRQKAINTAIKMAQKGDFVLITGKGHEKSMNYGHGEIDWNEFEVVKKALKEIN